jgi:hypothetical protein
MEDHMGTRADFYVGRGPNAEWIGSIAFDGYPDGITMKTEEKLPWPEGQEHIDWPEGKHLFDATTEAEFRERVERFFQYRDDATRAGLAVAMEQRKHDGLFVCVRQRSGLWNMFWSRMVACKQTAARR